MLFFSPFPHLLPFITFFSQAERVHSFRVLEIPFGIQRYDLHLSHSCRDGLCSLSGRDLSLEISPISRPNNNRPHIVAASCTRCFPHSSFSRFADSLGMALTRLLSMRSALHHHPRLQSYCTDEGKLLSTISRNVGSHKLPREQYLENQDQDYRLFMLQVEQFVAFTMHLIKLK